MLRMAKGIKVDSKEAKRGSCVREIDRFICFCEKERHRVWKDHMKRI